MTKKKSDAKSKKNEAGPAFFLKVLPWIAAVAVVVVAAAVLVFLKGPGKTDSGFQKGMGFVTWTREAYLNPSSDESLKKLRETGTEWVSILVTYYQTNCWTTDLRATTDTPSDEAVIHAITKARELGFKVMLKLHVDLLDTRDGGWRGEIGCSKEEDWDKWFKAYDDFLTHYVEIAVKEKVEMICVGTELNTTAIAKGNMWRDMIMKVRQKYSGLLMYAAHWDSYPDIRFWDALDYVGINAYFPLTEEITPTYEAMKEGWKKWVAEIEEFQKQVNKPIIFPECGCSSADGAAIRPWEHVSQREANMNIQADYYKALFESFWDKQWFYGTYWWYWGTNPRMGGTNNRGFTIQNKPAEKLVKEWYSKPVVREKKK